MIEKFAFFEQEKLVQAFISELNQWFNGFGIPFIVFYQECDVEVIRKIYAEVCGWSDVTKGIVFGELAVESISDKTKWIVFVKLDGHCWHAFKRGNSLLFSTSAVSSEQVLRAASRSMKLKVFEGV